MIVELQMTSTEPSRHTIHSLKYRPSQTSESQCTRLTSPVVPQFQFLSSHRHLQKKKLEVTRGEADHVEHIAIELVLGRQHALEVVHGISDLGPRERGGWGNAGRVRCDSTSTGRGSARACSLSGTRLRRRVG